jgi:lactam utilization protein B
MKTIDFNCDVGESFGVYQIGEDEGVMPYITSANIACGFHAGDPAVMEATVRLAAKYGVGIGAHPAYPDLQGFGRCEMRLVPEEVEALVLYQLVPWRDLPGQRVWRSGTSNRTVRSTTRLLGIGSLLRQLGELRSASAGR